MANRTISWSKTAIKQFEAAITYIASDSLANAEKVSSDIFKQLGKAVDNPEFFPPDKYKQDKDRSCRALKNIATELFTVSAIRISGFCV